MLVCYTLYFVLFTRYIVPNLHSELCTIIVENCVVHNVYRVLCKVCTVYCLLCIGGGVLTPKKTKKKTKPIYQFWCSDWFFWFFFWVFLVFFWFLLVFFFFLVFFGIFWDDILTLNLNTKKKPKNPKKTQKKPKKNQRSPKNQFPISNVGQGLCQRKPKKNSFQFRILAKTNAKKNKKKTKKNQCQFGNLKKKPKNKQKKPKKTNANLPILV